MLHGQRLYKRNLPIRNSVKPTSYQVFSAEDLAQVEETVEKFEVDSGLSLSVKGDLRANIEFGNLSVHLILSYRLLKTVINYPLLVRPSP